VMGRTTRITPSKTQAAWNDTNISYSFGVNTIQTVTRGNGRTVTVFDGLFRPVLVQSTDLTNGVSTYVNTRYDALGQVIFTSQPSGISTQTKGLSASYDALGRVTNTAENVAPFATTSTAYLSGHRTRSTDASGAQSTSYVNGFGELIRIAQPLGTNTYLNRNIWGQMTSLRQVGAQNGYWMDQSNTYVYDARQRLCRHHTNEGGSSLYAYDAANQMTSYAKGQSAGSNCSAPSGNSRVNLFYDTLGRTTATVFADPNTPNIARVYDANSNPTIIARAGVNWFYFYNELNLLTAEILQLDGRSFNAGYAYNTSAQMTGRSYPSGLGMSITVDGLGRPTRLQSGASIYAQNISYHPSGAIAAMAYGNGQVFSQTLTARLQPLRLRSVKGGTLALDLTYGYDPRGKVTSMTDAATTGNNRVYGYDALGRLTSANGPWGNGSYVYDVLGNLRVKTLGSRTITNTYNGLNRVTQSADTLNGTRSIGYDPRGNITSLGGQNFTYDSSDQPTSISGAASGNYLYDGNMKRVRSIVNGKTIYNVYDASGTLTHVDAVTDNKKTDYISKVARISNGVITYLHPDHLGSAVSGTTSTGAMAWTERYTPFGETMLSPTANDNLDGYTSHIKDAATGLNYMQARYYDPALGRFLSIDPVGFSPDMPFMFGRYSYVGNDPVNMWDPFGENPVAGAGIGCAVTGPACPVGAVAGAVIGTVVLIAGAVIIDHALNEASDTDSKSGPDVPEDLVGEDQRPTKGRVNSGPLAPENGGTGTAEGDFEVLTGGQSGPAKEDLGLPEGSRQGDNGVIIRPGRNGPRIDIPASGDKPHETLHFPPGEINEQ